jgi:hypothetical protein
LFDFAFGNQMLHGTLFEKTAPLAPHKSFLLNLAVAFSKKNVIIFEEVST